MANDGGGSPLQARQGSTPGDPSAGDGRGHDRHGGRGGARRRRPRPAAAGRSPAASLRWRQAFGPPREAGTGLRRPG